MHVGVACQRLCAETHVQWRKQLHCEACVNNLLSMYHRHMRLMRNDMPNPSSPQGVARKVQDWAPFGWFLEAV